MPNDESQVRDNRLAVFATAARSHTAEVVVPTGRDFARARPCRELLGAVVEDCVCEPVEGNHTE
jgi:hypothetical protein